MILLATAAMGTRFEVALPVPEGADRAAAERSLRAAGEEALREVELWHARLSRFEPASDIARLSRDPAARTDPETRALLDLCDQLHQDTEGAFSIRLGRRMERLGFHPDRAPAGELDLGAIAKGFALDRAAAILREAGIPSALLHGGTSSVIAFGPSPDDPRGWPIAIRSDTDPLFITLRDEALGVSAPRGRTLWHGRPAHVRAAGSNTPRSEAVVETGHERGKTPERSQAAEQPPPPHGPSRPMRRSIGGPPMPRSGNTLTHILDPRTGYPAPPTIDTAAVRGPSAAVCDAWSTALIVLEGRLPEAFPAECSASLHARDWSTPRSRTPLTTP